jgi:hypothetical protein
MLMMLVMLVMTVMTGAARPPVGVRPFVPEHGVLVPSHRALAPVGLKARVALAPG